MSASLEIIRGDHGRIEGRYQLHSAREVQERQVEWLRQVHRYDSMRCGEEFNLFCTYSRLPVYLLRAARGSEYPGALFSEALLGADSDALSGGVALLAHLIRWRGIGLLSGVFEIEDLDARRRLD